MGGFEKTAREKKGSLKPYVPRLVIEWARESGRTRHRLIEGTLVFVDISGFTAMCERLARKGKVGAEEVTDVLDLCFTHLLSIAYEYDGGVLKWGGDAVLLLFTGDDHAARACRAAVGMRQALRRFRRFRTTAGYVAVRMSVGCHSGLFDFFLVGGSHRELIITGPGATHTVQMESIATAGQIVISPATAALLPSDVVGRFKDGGLLLKGEPEARAARARPVENVTDDDLAPYVPASIREYLLTGGGETEHRHVAVAFIQFKGTSAMLAELGAEATAEALDRFIRTVQEAAESHGVSFHETDVDKDGGKVLLVAGAPRAWGDDDERMLRTLRRISDSESDLSLRIGVNSGYVFSGDFGPPYRRSYSIKGDAVNLAARIMAKAQPGQVLATEAVLARSATDFGAAALEPFMVKGKKRPVQAFAVGDIAGPKESTVQTDIPLVGRDTEMAALSDAMELAQSGCGRLVEIVAQPGMGKSRLLEELRNRAHDMRVMGAVCDPYETSTPYHPFRALLYQALDITLDAPGAEAARLLTDRLRDSAPQLLPWLPLLAVLLDVEVPSTAQTEQLELKFKKAKLEEVAGESFRTLLPGPALITFEDVHWMDDSSSDLLRHLVSTVGGTKWLVCVTRREQATGFAPPEDADLVTLRLAPLSTKDATSLATAVSDAAPLGPHALAALAERSGGNPLFLQELVSASQGAAAVDALPDTVETLLAAQIDRLSARDRALLRSAAVLGTTFPVDLFEETLGDEAWALRESDTWQRLADYLVRADGGVRFRHALIREAAYEGLPYRRRKELHGRVGATIERTSGASPEEQAALLSMHFFNAHVYDKAWRYSRIAGDRAREKFANVQAAEFYRRAVQAARDTGEVPAADLAAVHSALGDASERAGLYDQAARAYRSARRLLIGDPLTEAGFLLKEGVIRERSGRYSQALSWWMRGIRALRGSDHREAAAMRAQLSVWYGGMRRQQGKLREAIRWCLAAVSEAEAAGEKSALAHAFRLLDWIYTDMGSPESAKYRELVLPLYEELGDITGQADMLNQLGMHAYFEGRWQEAIEFYRLASEAAAKTGDAVNAAHGTNNIGEILSDQGHLDRAEAMFHECLRVWRAARFGLGVAFAKSNLGRVATRRNQYEDAHARFAEAVREFGEIGAEGQVLETEARMAENFLFSGDATRALSQATETLDLTESLGGLTVLRAMLHRIRGYAQFHSDLDAADRALEQSLSVGRSVHADYEVALTLEAKARLAELKEDPSAASIAEQAVALLERLGVVTTPHVPLVPDLQILATDGQVPAPLA